MIQLLAFDMGGVIMEIDPQQALRRFQEIGLTDAATYLDPYSQKGFFGDFEGGRYSAEEFRTMLSDVVGRELTHEECAYGWLGYRVGQSQANLDKVQELRRRGYRVVLLSNTNPYMMDFARSTAFDGGHHGITHYFDKLYLSYEMRLSKPSTEIFERMLEEEGVSAAQTLFIDDSPRNVAAAAALGIKTMQPATADAWPAEIDALLETF